MVGAGGEGDLQVGAAIDLALPHLDAAQRGELGEVEERASDRGALGAGDDLGEANVVRARLVGVGVEELEHLSGCAGSLDLGGIEAGAASGGEDRRRRGLRMREGGRWGRKRDLVSHSHWLSGLVLIFRTALTRAGGVELLKDNLAVVVDRRARLATGSGRGGRGRGRDNCVVQVGVGVVDDLVLLTNRHLGLQGEAVAFIRRLVGGTRSRTVETALKTFEPAVETAVERISTSTGLVGGRVLGEGRVARQELNEGRGDQSVAREEGEWERPVLGEVRKRS